MQIRDLHGNAKMSLGLCFLINDIWAWYLCYFKSNKTCIKVGFTYDHLHITCFITIVIGCKWGTMSQHDYFRKTLQVFSPKKPFSYEWILEQCFLQVLIINAYSFPNTLYIYTSFLNKYEFLKVSWFFINLVLCL